MPRGPGRVVGEGGRSLGRLVCEDGLCPEPGIPATVVVLSAGWAVPDLFCKEGVGVGADFPEGGAAGRAEVAHTLIPRIRSSF